MIYVIAYGNPFNGLELEGPFSSHEEAIQYAEDEMENGEQEHWFVVPVKQPGT